MECLRWGHILDTEKRVTKIKIWKESQLAAHRDQERKVKALMAHNFVCL